MIILFIDLKFVFPDELLLSSISFFSSFASNLLYLFGDPQRQNIPPSLDVKDFKEGQGWEVP